MKKITTALLIIITALLLVSCDSENSVSETSGSAENSEVIETTEAEAVETEDPQDAVNQIYVMKVTGDIDTEYSNSCPIAFYNDSEGNDNIAIDDFTDVDFSEYVLTEDVGSVTLDDGIGYYTVADGTITEATTDDISKGDIIVLSYLDDGTGEFVTSIYIYKQ